MVSFPMSNKAESEKKKMGWLEQKKSPKSGSVSFLQMGITSAHSVLQITLATVIN